MNKTKTKKQIRDRRGKYSNSKRRLRKVLITLIILIIGYGSVLTYMNERKEIELLYLNTIKTITDGNFEPNSGVLEVLVGTEMEGAIPHIKKASKYYDLPESLYVGIANAESSLNKFKCYNPWGIGNNGPRCYDNWEQSVNGFSQLLKYYYFAEGKITPEQLLRKYVGWNNPHWVDNVKVYYNPEVIIKF